MAYAELFASLRAVAPSENGVAWKQQPGPGSNANGLLSPLMSFLSICR